MSAETIVNIISIISVIILVFLGRCIFKPKTQDSYEQVNHCEDDATQEDTEEEKPDISEPVISFVEVFKNNPSRFKVTYRKRDFIFHNGDKDTLRQIKFEEFKDIFLIQDLKQSVNYEVGIQNVRLRHGRCLRYYDVIRDLSSDKNNSKTTCKLENLDWLTYDEKTYLIQELYEGIFLKNKGKVDTLLGERRKKNKERRRNKLKKLYCEEK